MKKYEVIALSVSGLGGKMFNAKDIVTEANFPKGNAPELVKQGFLKEIESDGKLKSEAKPKSEDAKPKETKKPVKK